MTQIAMHCRSHHNDSVHRMSIPIQTQFQLHKIPILQSRISEIGVSDSEIVVNGFKQIDFRFMIL